MKPFLMGVETEYAVSGRNRQGEMDFREVHSLLYRALQRERRWLHDVTGGEALYLETGARFYLDYGGHPEYASPECFTPAQVTAYDKAGEYLLELARQRVQAQRPDVTITILKNNLNPLFPDDITWGTHESYTCWGDTHKAAQTLLPHLVTRTIYAGSGCLSAFPAGSGFELSQRARHILHAIGSETTGERSLFCTRIRKASDCSARQGWTRAHLISKDSQRAPLGIYLTYGTTGLIFLLLNEGNKVGQSLKLEHPLKALRTISCDPWLKTKVRLADGREMTAVEIQEGYLADCQRVVQNGGFPEWANDVLRHWNDTLVTLARDPLRMARKLDPYYKLMVYQHELERAGCTWSELRQALQDLTTLREQYPAEVLQAILEENVDSYPTETQGEVRDACALVGIHRPGKLEQLHLAVRLRRFDLHYHELGGVYDQMVASGHLQNVVISQKDIEKASREAPQGGRAGVRGDFIKAFEDRSWLCEWRYLYHEHTGEFLDLRNPFSNQFKAGYWSRVSMDEAGDPDVQEILMQLGRR